MISKLPKQKIRSSLRSRFDSTSVSQTHAVAWLSYQLFLKKLALAAAEKAREDKSAVIREYHVKMAAKEVLHKFNG